MKHKVINVGVVTHEYGVSVFLGNTVAEVYRKVRESYCDVFQDEMAGAGAANAYHECTSDQEKVEAFFEGNDESAFHLAEEFLPG